MDELLHIVMTYLQPALPVVFLLTDIVIVHGSAVLLGDLQAGKV